MPRGTGLRMLAALGAARALVLPRRCAARSLARRAATDTERGAPKLPKGAIPAEAVAGAELPARPKLRRENCGRVTVRF